MGPKITKLSPINPYCLTLYLAGLFFKIHSNLLRCDSTQRCDTGWDTQDRKWVLARQEVGPEVDGSLLME